MTTDTVNSSNRLTVATSPAGKVEFTYDYMGRRVEKKVFQLSSGTFQLVKTERFVYDGFKQIEKLDGGNSNAVLQKITWQPERLGQDVPLSIVAVNSDSTTMNYYYFTDANKNVGQLMDAAGNVVAKYEYSPFGEVTAQSGAYADANAFRFSSEYADAETGLVYYNYRYYYPMIGKWISRDPIEEDSQEFDLYIFCKNSNINRYDRLGLDATGFLINFFIKQIVKKPFKGDLADDTLIIDTRLMNSSIECQRWNASACKCDVYIKKCIYREFLYWRSEQEPSFLLGKLKNGKAGKQHVIIVPTSKECPKIPMQFLDV